MKMEEDVHVSTVDPDSLPVPPDSPDDFLHELSCLSDAVLFKATVESLHTGRLTPLIKEELRCRIQSRRLSEGKEELRVQFESPSRLEVSLLLGTTVGTVVCAWGTTVGTVVCARASSVFLVTSIALGHHRSSG
ncbi:hypothetical protein ACOMHN_018460 [Nucella lapillus]